MSKVTERELDSGVEQLVIGICTDSRAHNFAKKGKRRVILEDKAYAASVDRQMPELEQDAKGWMILHEVDELPFSLISRLSAAGYASADISEIIAYTTVDMNHSKEKKGFGKVDTLDIVEAAQNLLSLAKEYQAQPSQIVELATTGYELKQITAIYDLAKDISITTNGIYDHIDNLIVAYSINGRDAEETLRRFKEETTGAQGLVERLRTISVPNVPVQEEDLDFEPADDDVYTNADKQTPSGNTWETDYGIENAERLIAARDILCYHQGGEVTDAISPEVLEQLFALPRPLETIVRGIRARKHNDPETPYDIHAAGYIHGTLDDAVLVRNLSQATDPHLLDRKPAATSYAGDSV